ncbi:hypothetical protein DM860_004063 [Cuscuta australis]|uniref:Uncharacterized protein n=1 Tax=Cuscuta australis TaxID=267555 RepID=A0A328CXW4_9ASTE|nr:hypothetical protein DM860_004063 [Cuscuta australis]
MAMIAGDGHAKPFFKAVHKYIQSRETLFRLPISRSTMVELVDHVCDYMVNNSIDAIVAGWEFLMLQGSIELWRPYLWKSGDVNVRESSRLVAIGSGAKHARRVLRKWETKPPEESQCYSYCSKSNEKCCRERPAYWRVHESILLDPAC